MGRLASIVLLLCLIVAICTMLWWIARDKDRPRMIEIDWRPEWWVELRMWWEDKRHPQYVVHRDEVDPVVAVRQPIDLGVLGLVKYEWSIAPLPTEAPTSERIVKTAFVGKRMFTLTKEGE